MTAAKKNLNDPYNRRDIGANHLNLKKFKDAVSEYKIAAMYSPRIIPEIIIDFEKYLQINIDDIQARLALVDFYLSLGDIDSAQIELEELVEIAPETASVYNLLGRIYLRGGRLDGAILLLEKALNVGRGDMPLLEALASAYIEKERHADAILIYEKILKDDPGSKRTMRTLRELYMRIRDFDGAARVSSQMLLSDPENLSEAENILKELADTCPNSAFIKEQLAKVYIMSLKPGKAVHQLEKIFKISPQKIDDIIGYLRKILTTYPDHHESMFFLSEAITQKGGNFSEAVELVDKVVLLNPNYLDKAIKAYKSILKAYPKQAMAHLSLAEIYSKKEMVEDALMEYLEVVKINPSEIEKIEKKCRDILKSDPKKYTAYIVLAEAFLSKGEMRKAISISEELMEKDKTNINAYLIAGEAYSKIGVLIRSKECFRAALQLSPFNVEAQKKYQEAYEKNLDAEILSIKGKIEQDPWRVALNLDLAKLLYQNGNLDAAILALQNASKDPGRAPFAHNLLGLIFKEQGRYDLAAAQFEKSLEYKNIDDQNLLKTIKSNLGSACEALGNIAKAVSYYESVISQDIEFGDLKERVKRLNTANSFFVRNKMLAVFFSTANNDIAYVWGQDYRKNKGMDDNITLMSFSQDENNKAFENAVSGRISTAEEEFILSIQLDSGGFCSINNLGAILLKNKNMDAASLKMHESLSRDFGNAVFHNNLGVLYVLQGDFEKAEKEFNNSLKTDRNLNVANINLGDLEMKKGNFEEAIECYRKIMPFDPIYEYASRRLKYWAV